jgi:hypothetical protein
MSGYDVSERWFEQQGEHREPEVAEVAGSELAGLLDAVVAFAGRFVVTTDAQAAAVALWVVHTHALDAFEQTPYLAVTSAEKRSGKTRLFDVLELLVARPWRAVTPTEAVVFRKIEANRPTLLLDEVDAIFGPKAREHEGLRALLNAGNRKGTTVPRCVGPTQQVQDFSVFCAKALAGIGDLPDTVADRAVRIRLKRKAPGERAEPFRRRDVDDEALALHEWMRSVAENVIEELTVARPDLPDELDDREQDSWEPLLALADLAGAEWPRRARSAALELAAEKDDEQESLGVRLLADCRIAFEDEDRLASAVLCEKLTGIEESPWGDRRGKPLDQRGLARLLRPYGIRSKQQWIDGRNVHGYRRDYFEDAWNRYVFPETPPRTLGSLEPASGAGSGLVRRALDGKVLADSGTGSNSDRKPGLAGLADRRPDTEAEAPPAVGDEGFSEFVHDRCHAGHLTATEWLERRKLEALVGRAAA